MGAKGFKRGRYLALSPPSFQPSPRMTAISRSNTAVLGLNAFSSSPWPLPTSLSFPCVLGVGGGLN
eukprot:1974666-Rhodomonas_salina.1